MKRLFVIGLLLLPTTALALSYTRTEVRVEDVQVCIRKGGNDPTFAVFFKTYDEAGEVVRNIAGRDLWAQLTATQKNQIRNIITAVSDSIYSQEAVPTPTAPAPTPTP